MIGVVIRDIPYLKLLHPICMEIDAKNVNYNLYLYDTSRGQKEYVRASVDNVKKSSPAVLSKANKIIRFSNDKQLKQYMVSDKISKMVSVEIGLWADIKFLKTNKIKAYSVQYLSDSLWTNSNNNMYKVFYTAAHIMNVHHKFFNHKANENRDKLLGSPLFDSITNMPSTGKDVLLLLPNLRVEHVNKAFRNKDRFINIIKKLSKDNNLIFKTRKKQWFPPEIKQYAKEILEDGDIMFPTTISSLLPKTHTTIMFQSSGLYEAVYGGNYVINVEIPVNRWSWNQSNMREYFSTQEGSLYNSSGVVKSVTQEQVLSENFSVTNELDNNARLQWIKKFIGASFDNSSKLIANEVLGT